MTQPDRVAPRLLRGYGPLLGFAVMFTAMAVLVPSVRTEVRQEVVEASSVARSGTTAGGPGHLTPGDGATEVLGATTVQPTEAGGSIDPSAGGATGGSGSTTGGTAGASGVRSPGAAGVAGGVGGVGKTPAAAAGSAPAIAPCGDRQVAGDPYSPPCFTFSGNNGGVTSKGVTGDKIVVSIRIEAFSTGLVDAVADAAGAKLPPEDEADIRRTLDGLVDFFNRTYQFYGRKIDLRIFNGRGNVLQETLGGGQEGAQSDAIKVADEIQAFADVSAVTAPFSDALAQRKVLAFGAPYLSRKWLTARQPYVWSQFIDCTSIAESSASYMLNRLIGRPAVNAGGALNNQPRRVGVIMPSNSWYLECLDDALALLSKSGVQPATVQKYNLDLGTITTQAASLLPKMQENGVTTVACYCDPLLLKVLTANADNAGYQPEWVNTGVALTDQDIVGQLFGPTWRRSLGVSFLGASAPAGKGVGYQAFKAVRPNQQPTVGVDLLYGQLQLLAIGIQMAGPNLTPESFAQGMFRYPTRTGPLGTWKFGPGDYTTSQDAREIYWDPTQKSPQTGGMGTYVETEPNKRYPIGGWSQSNAVIPGLAP